MWRKTFRWLGVVAVLCARTLWAADGVLELNVVDRDSSQPLAVRMHLKNAAGKPVLPPKTAAFHDHFAFADKISLKLPTGNYTFEIERGPEYLWRQGNFRIDTFANDSKTIDLKRFADLSKEGWWSGDLDVRRPLEQMELLLQAEDLHVAPVTTWWNGKSDLKSPPPADKLLVTVDQNRCYHQLGCGDSRAGGTLLFLNGAEPPYAKPAAPEYPPNVELALATRKTGAWVDAQRPFDWDLPVLVAHAAIDSLEVHNRHQGRDTVIDNENNGKPRNKSSFAGLTGNGRWSQQIYYHLLNCGLRIPPSAGSGSGQALNPVGYNRVYVYLNESFTYQRWWTALAAGRCFVTNGPLLRAAVEGQAPGHVFYSSGDPFEFNVGLTLSVRSPDKISYLEVVKNGEVVISQRLDEWKKNEGRLPPVVFKESGWFLIRAVCDTPKTYRHAMTAPYYVEIGEKKRRISKSSSQFFLDWVMERARQLKIEDEQQRQVVLGYHRVARDYFQKLIDQANAD